MVGYAYIDLDGNIVYKIADYIERVNPGFFGQNRHLIVKHWKFNTEDPLVMLSMFKSFNDLNIPGAKLAEFIKNVGFDMSTLEVLKKCK